MIDKNGKVFGKINIIDLIVIVVLVLAIGVFGYVKISNSVVDNDDPKKMTVDTADGDELYITYYAEEVPEYVANRVKTDSFLMDADTNMKLGVVTDVKVDEAVTYSNTDDGKVVASSKEGYNSIKITGKTKGKLGKYGAEISTMTYGVGHSLTLRAGDAKIFLKIYDIKTAG